MPKLLDDDVAVKRQLDDLCTLDLRALYVARAWGAANGHVERVSPVPCPRPDCGGSVMVWGGERRCLLCARPYANGFAIPYELDL